MSVTSLRTITRLASMTAVLLAGTIFGEVPPDQTSPPEAYKLVQLLGDARHGIREAATEALIEMGPPAETALQEGTRSYDLEIQLRSRRILLLMNLARQAAEADQRLVEIEAFRQDRLGLQGRTLPGWERFKELAGDEQAARDLFAGMYVAEWKLVSRAASDPKWAADELALRCLQLDQDRIANQAANPAVICALLFVACDEQIDLPQAAGNSLFNILFHDQGAAVFDTDGNARIVLGAWIASSRKTWDSYRIAMTAMKFKLPDGLVPLREMLAADSENLHYRQYEILGLAKLGHRGDAALLQAYMNNQAVCARSNRRVAGMAVQLDTQLRDIALAAYIKLHQQDPREFGFSELREHDIYLYVPSSLGFASEQQRQAAFALWDEYRRNTIDNQGD